MIRLIILTLVMTNTLFAKRDRRKGLNFGAGFHIAGGVESQSSDAKSETDVQSVKPYLGYVVTDNLNIGISGLFESQETNESYATSDNTIVNRKTKSKLNGTQVFARFMFAKYMFFEGGIGLYNQTKNYNMIERQASQSGSFEESSDTVKGVGLGHHLGAGLELPIVNGFYFVTTFSSRTIELRNEESDGTVGTDASSINKRELTFGFNHYVN